MVHGRRDSGEPHQGIGGKSSAAGAAVRKHMAWGKANARQRSLVGAVGISPVAGVDVGDSVVRQHERLARAQAAACCCDEQRRRRQGVASAWHLVSSRLVERVFVLLFFFLLHHSGRKFKYRLI